MVVLTASGISKSFGERSLFEDVGFEIHQGEKIGLIGANGAGKTTLFRLITGADTPDSGAFTRAKGLRIGYMEQMVAARDSRTAFDAALDVFAPLIETERRLNILTERLKSDHSDSLIAEQHALRERFERDGGLTYRSRTRAALLGLGLDENQLALPLTALSGGQLSKLSLARLLLSDAGLLLLDEPTNHLDLAASEWLESYLTGYKGAALIISHDRYFLDAVTTRTAEIENNRMRIYDGGYSVFMKKKRQQREADQRAYDNTMREIGRLEEVIKQQHRWNREKNIRTADSKQKQVDRLRDGLVKPESEPESIRFNFHPALTGANEVLVLSGLSAGFDGRTLYSDVGFTLSRGERMFLLGGNGCGKTTLLRRIMAGGDGIRTGNGVRIGYFDQTQSTLHDEKTALDEIWDEYRGMTQTDIRNALAVFLFRGDDVYEQVGELSGGERARLAILKLMLSGANLLLLDEPTNHLDLYARSALEEALASYGGTMLIVSHDRRFINRLADRVAVMENGGVTIFDGNYDYYLSHRSDTAKGISKPQKTVGAGGTEYKAKKEFAARVRRLKSAIAAAERESDGIDDELARLNEELSNPETAADYKKSMELTEQISVLTGRQDELTDRWAELSAELEQLIGGESAT